MKLITNYLPKKVKKYPNTSLVLKPFFLYSNGNILSTSGLSQVIYMDVLLLLLCLLHVVSN